MFGPAAQWVDDRYDVDGFGVGCEKCLKSSNFHLKFHQPWTRPVELESLHFVYEN